MAWKSKLILIKFYIQRVMSYASILNFFMLTYLVLDRLNLRYTNIVMGLIIIGTIFISIGLGYLEDKCGLAKEEFELNARKMGLLK